MKKISNYRMGVLSSAIILSFSAIAATEVDRSSLQLAGSEQVQKVVKGQYIVQMKGASAIRHLAGKDIPQRISANSIAMDYDAKSSSAQSYMAQITAKRNSVIAATGTQPIHTYGHTFNGFTAKLSDKQVSLLESHPDVLKVWPEEIMQTTTSNTPLFLGLTAAGGLHLNGQKGEDVIVGVVDTGINFEHPSFADDGSYSDLPEGRWNGSCDNSTDETITCNNKIIGAQFFNDSFVGGAELAANEVNSPRDQDGHGSHTASTAAGNEISAKFNQADAGIASGMAPRARVAAYKACWDAVNPDQTGCYGGDTMAAIEAAVEDGVDVINYSIGGSRTALITPPAQAFLDAAIAGIYTATSAGNDGPDAGTIGMPVPWVTNVGASTYDGTTLTAGAAVVGGTLDGEIVLAPEGGFSVPLLTSGAITQELVISDPVDGCGVDTPLANAAEIAGKLAFISRGSCGFVEKVSNAEAAGAIGVVVYNNAAGEDPIPMGGDGATGVPAVMIGNNEGTAIVADIMDGGLTVSMTISPAIAVELESQGNMMADFSSRGPNLAVADLMIPDITAPGVNILAAKPTGDTSQYLSGTSMAAPHIAGIAALIKEAHPDWTPAAIQSAMMTSARQNVTKEDGLTQADAFDFGAGHVVPNDAVNPGLVYDAGIYDYLGFICGKADEANTVTQYGFTCDQFEGAGYLGGADYNQPSITVSELGESRAIIRYVTNVSGVDATFNANVEAPEGVDATLLVLGESGFAPATSMTIAAGGTGTYGLMLVPNATAELDAWKFGSVAWSDGAHNVRIPLTVKVVQPPQIDVVSELVVDTNSSRPRIALPVTTNYNGRLFVKGHGMAEASLRGGQVFQDEDQTFTFNETSLGFHTVDVVPGTKAVRFSLRTDQMPTPATDLDLFVYACNGGDCTQVGTSLNAASDESVTLIDPEPLFDASTFTTYIVFVHGYNLDGAADLIYPLNVHLVGDQESNLSVRASSRTRDGGATRVSLNMRNIEAGNSYLGGVTFTNGENEEIGFTLVEVNR